MARKKAKALPPKMITVYGEILQETELAILVRCDEDADGVWLPKSRIKYEGERGDTGVEIEIPELLADEKGFFDGMGKPAADAENPAAVEPTPPCSKCLESQNWPEMLSFKDGKIVFDEDEPVILLPDACRECLHWPYDHDVPDDELADNFDPAPDFSEVDDTPPARRNFGDNVKWLKEERITVSAPLSEAEKARYADEMAALDGEIEALKDERAEVSNRLKKAIDAKEEERLALSRAVNEGETREVLCDCLKDYNTGEMVWTEAHPPYAEVLRRAMTKEEKQPSLLEFQEKNGQTPSPADEAECEGVDFDAITGQPDEAAITLAPAENETAAEDNTPAEPEADPQEAA